MAKQIIAWCDPHLTNKQEQVVGNQHIISIDGKPRALDMCDVCFKELVEPLAELLKDVGQLVDAPARIRPEASGQLECPVGGCRKTYAKREALRKHVERTHDMALSDIEARLAPAAQTSSSAETSDEQLALVDDESDAELLQCPDCDKSFAKKQALGAHRARTHGYRTAHVAVGG